MDCHSQDICEEGVVSERGGGGGREGSDGVWIA